MSNNRSPEWGISTGLLFNKKGLPLLQQVRQCLQYNPGIIELCPNSEIVSETDIDELKAIADHENLLYTVHSPTALQYNPRTKVPDYPSWKYFTGQNRVSWQLADQVDALWIVQHPPMIPVRNPFPNAMRAAFGVMLNEQKLRTPFFIEVGAQSKDGVSEEDGREPVDLKEYLHGCIVDTVGDVPKISRFREPLGRVQRVMTDIDLYFRQCLEQKVPMRELHVLGTEKWPEDLDFDRYALEKLRYYGFVDTKLVIESTPGRLPEVISLVKDHLGASTGARHFSTSQVGSLLS